MAIVIENVENEKDKFKIKCQCCGRDLTYLRSDIKSHRRWPNGFVYCPGCGTPNGHNEENIILHGEEIEKQNVAKLSIEKLLEEHRKYKKLSIILAIISSILIIAGLIAFLFLLLKITSVGNAHDERIYGLFLPIPITFFFIGLFLLPITIISHIKLGRINVLISKKAQYEKDSD